MVNANSLAGLMKWLARDEWQEDYADVIGLHTGVACARAEVSTLEMSEILGEHHSDALWGCVFEDFLTRDNDDGSNIVDDYLKRRGFKESATAKRYMSALRTSVMSLYEVSDIVRDRSFLARDLVRGGEPVRISERSGTHYLKPWDRIGARIVRLGPDYQMTGGVLPFERESSETVLDLLRRAKRAIRKGAGKLVMRTGEDSEERPTADAVSDTELLSRSAFIFTNVWLEDTLQRLANPVLPKLCNTDGDDIAFTTVIYPLRGASTAAIGLALDAIPTLRRESDVFWNWLEVTETRKKTSESQMLISTLDDGTTVMGSIELKEGTLILAANSVRRADEGRKLIESRLTGLVGEPHVETKTIEQVMASRSAGEPPKRASSGLLPDEERAIIHANLDQHYVKLLDDTIPMLGDVTPRRAVKTAKGREKVVEWLKFLENQAARRSGDDPMAGYDFGWMWQALGVAHLRR